MGEENRVQNQDQVDLPFAVRDISRTCSGYRSGQETSSSWDSWWLPETPQFRLTRFDYSGLNYCRDRRISHQLKLSFQVVIKDFFLESERVTPPGVTSVVRKHKSPTWVSPTSIVHRDRGIKTLHSNCRSPNRSAGGSPISAGVWPPLSERGSCRSVIQVAQI
jgi:hypothetical protein